MIRTAKKLKSKELYIKKKIEKLINISSKKIYLMLLFV